MPSPATGALPAGSAAFPPIFCIHLADTGAEVSGRRFSFPGIEKPGCASAKGGQANPRPWTSHRILQNTLVQGNFVKKALEELPDEVDGTGGDEGIPRVPNGA